MGKGMREQSVLDGIKHKAAEMLANPEIRTKKEVWKQVDIAESTLYNWMKDKDFIELVNKKVEKYTDQALPEVWAALIDKATSGDTQAIKLFFEMKDKYRDRKEFHHSGLEGLGSNLDGLSDAELAEMERLARKAEKQKRGKAG